jgi:phage-related protein
VADAKLVIDVVVESAKAQAGLKGASDSAGKFSKGISKMAGPAAVTLGVIGGFGVAAVKSASRTQQAFGGLDAVFGKSAGQMKDWAKGAGTSMGLSASQYAEGASKIGAQLKNLGVPMDQVSGKTNDMMKMGADLAATYGGTTTEAVDALSAALRGEADPAERYGLALSQTAVKAQMAADGTDKLTGKAAQQAKTTALLSLATKQAGGALGQFARESDSAAGSAQIAQAEWDNAKSTLGTALLPIVAQVAKWLGKLSVFVQKNATVFQILVVIIGLVAAAILVAAAAQAIMNLALLAFPGTWIVLAIIAVIAIIVLLWNKCEGFRNVVFAVWNAIKIAFTAMGVAVQAVARFFVAAWNVIAGAVAAAWAKIVAIAGGIGAYFARVWNLVKLSASLAWNFIAGVVKAVVGKIVAIGKFIAAPYIAVFKAIKVVAQLVFQVLRIGFELIRAVAIAVVQRIKAVWVSIFNAIRSFVVGVINKIVAVIRPVAVVARQIATTIKTVFVTAWNGIKTAATAVFAAVRAVVSRILAPIRAVATSIKAGFVAGFNAIRSLAGSVASAVRAVFDRITAPIRAVAAAIRSTFVGAFNALRSAASRAGSAMTAPFRALSSAISWVIRKVQDLINILSRIHVPSISLPGGMSTRAATSSGMAMRSPGMELRAASPVRLSGARTGGSRAAVGATVVNVNGALDPDAVARQIERILSGAQRRRSGVTLGQRAPA